MLYACNFIFSRFILVTLLTGDGYFNFHEQEIPTQFRDGRMQNIDLNEIPNGKCIISISSKKFTSFFFGKCALYFFPDF